MRKDVNFLTHRLIPIFVLYCQIAFGVNGGDIFNQELVSSASEVIITVSGVDLFDEYSSSLTAESTELELGRYGQTHEFGRPILPIYSRFIAVPPQAKVNLHISSPNIVKVTVANPPNICVDDQVTAHEFSDYQDDIYPSSWGEISDPIIIRGVRLVKLTLYPVRHNKITDEFIYAKNLQAQLKFSEGDPLNPVIQPVRRGFSAEFTRFTNNFAENCEVITMDDLEQAQNPGHYLVVVHESCLQYIAPFIEWRRMTGYRMDILSIEDGISRDPSEIKPLIQARYDEFIEAGLEPFDQLFLVGDRSSYTWQAASDWQLESPGGETIWRGINHADYKYALLEGDDNYPDVGFSRWCAGDPDRLELFVGRQLLYEAEPHMDNPEWFGRGAVYSQHWGNDPEGAWHPSIHTNVRWASEVLKNKGFNDIRSYENYEYDQWGSELGPFVREQFNEGVNLLLGRAENLHWNQNFNGVNDNVIFPLRLVLSGHGEYTTWTMLRTGDGEHLRGTVASTCNWGGPPTITTTASWLELVKAVVIDELSYGWSRVMAITKVETNFPDFEFGNGWNAYSHIRTDNDYYGDPGLKAWTGVPQLVDVEFADSISQNATAIEVMVTDHQTGNSVTGAIVTLYDPGDMPDYDDDEYADYAGMVVSTQLTDEDGIARIMIDDSFDLRDGSSVNLTVHGKLIKPERSEIIISTPDFSIDISEFEISDHDGNNIDPGEEFELFITAVNNIEADVEDVIAVASTNSEFISVISDTIAFGDIEADDQVRGEHAFQFIAAASIPDGESNPSQRPMIAVQFSNGNGSSMGAIELDPVAPNISIVEIVEGAILPLGEEDYELDIVLHNNGRSPLIATAARLVSPEMWIDINRDASAYPQLDVDESTGLNDEAFTLTVNPKAVPGMQTELHLLILGEVETLYDIPFSVQLGEQSEDAPQGPDIYGMICLDDTDSDWESAPEYDWVEISLEDRNRDFDGILIDDFNGNSPFNIGRAVAVPLPFEIGFYGQVFDTISVCTNGFICPGNQSEITNFQNWRLDEAIGGGAGMIAPFWDWLRFVDGSGVYYYYDEENHRFIIEWYQNRQRPDIAEDLTFQVILFDRAEFARESGDTDILMQYKTISNRSGMDNIEDNSPYASVGISSPDGKSGINYTYRGEYPLTSAPLENQRVIKFTSSLREYTGEVFGRVTDAEGGAAIAGAVVKVHGLSAVTDEEGRYRIDRVVIGSEFDVIGNHEIYDDSTSFDHIIEGDDPLEINLILRRSLSAPKEDNLQLPHDLQIHAVYPQPFNSYFNVKFSVASGKRSVLSVYSLNGQLVKRVEQDDIRTGVQTVSIDTHNMATGVYLVRLQSGGVSRAVKVVNIR